MRKLLTIIGARPQIIKAAAISRAIERFNEVTNEGVSELKGERIEEHILHTGQHYDVNMSEVFFRELGIPEPEYNLHVGSASHGVQTAKMIIGIENVLMEHSFGGVILYGDTNSTLAGAIAASKLQIPVYHIEAGLRSFNMSMPEEINRIVADRLGSLLFAPTETAVRNLRNEGMIESVVLSGDVMYDNALYFSEMADAKSDIIERLGLRPKQYVLATIHRPANTDNKENLCSIIRALGDIAASGVDVIFPCHPRTRKKILDFGFKIEDLGIRIIEPASFFEIIRLEKNARVVMTDSGGVQKEAFFYGTPCVILRPETEWVEIVDAGAGILADADYERIMSAYKELSGREVKFPALFGDGHAAEHIVRVLAGLEI